MEHYLGVAKELGIAADELGAAQSIVMAVSAGRVRAQFKEVRGFVTRGLASRGFIPATAADATMAVFVRYGIGAPQVTAIASSSPVTGWIPGTTTTTQGTITGAAGSAVYGATSTTTGSYGVVGTQTTTSTETSYTRWLMLNGVDVGQFRRNGSLVEIWRTGVVSDGYSGDLRRVLPVLVAQAMPYVGRPTSRGERSMLFENDKRVKALRAP